MAQLALAGEAGLGLPAAPGEEADVPRTAADAAAWGSRGRGAKMVGASALPPRHVEDDEGGRGRGGGGEKRTLAIEGGLQ